MIREDALVDVLFGGVAGVGAAMQAALGAAALGTAGLTDEWLERQYAQGGVNARVVDLVADDCWSRGFEIEGDEDDYLKDALEALQIDIVGPTVQKWQSLYGAGAWIVFANDGSATFKDPLNIANLQSIDELLPIEATALNVFQYYTDYRNPNYGRPEIYQVRAQGFDNTRKTGASGTGTSSIQFLVHETRLIRFPGAPLPMNLRQGRKLPWQGRSDLGACFEDSARMHDALKWAVEILKKKQQAIHKFAGLSTLLTNDYNGDNEKAIRKQITLADSARNALNGVTVDGDDDYTVKDLSLGGVVDVIREFKECYAASAGYPVSVLFGRATSGISTNGDNDLENYYGFASKRQKTRIKPGLVTLIKLLLLCKNAPVISKWQVEFCPLWVPSEKDQAQAELFEGQGQQATATALTSYITEQVMSPAQVTNYLAKNGMFGLTENDMIKDPELLDPHSEANEPPQPITLTPGVPAPAGTTQEPK